MRLCRQFLLLVSLMFWQGGFMFYGGVVVPVGSRVLGSDTQQGFITQAVTNYLNLAGFICLIVWAENLWHERRQGTSKLEWGTSLFAFVLLISLIVIHLEMDQVLDQKTTSIVDHVRFGMLHKLYIGISSLEWVASLFQLILLIRRWNACASFQARLD